MSDAGYVIKNRMRDDNFYVRWTGIGPMFGSLDEAARFGSREEAMQTRVFSFPLCVVEVVPLDGEA